VEEARHFSIRLNHTRFKFGGASTIAAPKSANAIAKISNADDAIPGRARGRVEVKKLVRPRAPRLLEAFSMEPSAIRKPATIGHNTNGKRKKTMMRVIPVIE